MSIYIPYTYLVGWSKLNTWYYGVRFARNCNPSDLWIAYFTSSKMVKKFRKEHGEPDIVQIRKTFLNKEDALEWEHKVLRRMKVIRKNNWLNKTDNRSIINDKETMKFIGQKVSKALKGRLKSEEHCRNISLSKKGKKQNVTQEGKKLMIEASHTTVANTKRSKSISNKIWITNGESNKRIDKTSEIPKYWYIGRSNFKTTFNQSRLEFISKLGKSNSKEVIYQDVKYCSMREASRSTGISVYLLKTLGAKFI